ncbi:hypothetical protein BaRGS_00018430, partial [Batillaria attramentaria]
NSCTILYKLLSLLKTHYCIESAPPYLSVSAGTTRWQEYFYPAILSDAVRRSRVSSPDSSPMRELINTLLLASTWRHPGELEA